MPPTNGPSLTLTLFVTPTCAICPTYKPQIADLAKQRGIPLSILDASAPEQAWLVGELDLQSVPTVVLFRGAEPVDQVVGPRANAVQRMLAAAAQ